MESDSEGEEDEEEVVVEVEPRPSSLSLQDRITVRQFEHTQVSHIRLAPKLKLLKFLILLLICVCVLLHALQMELKECRLRLAEERRARLKAESRIMEVKIISKILTYDFWFTATFLCSSHQHCGCQVCGHCNSFSVRDLVSAKLYVMTQQDGYSRLTL